MYISYMYSISSAEIYKLCLLCLCHINIVLLEKHFTHYMHKSADEI